VVSFEFVFWASLPVLAAVLALTYWRSKDIYPLFYVLAVFTYTDAVVYMFDAYDMGRNTVIAVLAVSAVILTAAGYAISQHRNTDAAQETRAKRDQ
jgi:hypothetical protein